MVMTTAKDRPTATHTALSIAASLKEMTWGLRWMTRRSNSSRNVTKTSRAGHAQPGTSMSTYVAPSAAARRVDDVTSGSPAGGGGNGGSRLRQPAAGVRPEPSVGPGG